LGWLLAAYELVRELHLFISGGSHVPKFLSEILGPYGHCRI
ncbi:hypothetical protein QIL87_gp1, partial [ssRNA phage Gerhypos.2_8]